MAVHVDDITAAHIATGHNLGVVYIDIETENFPEAVALIE